MRAGIVVTVTPGRLFIDYLRNGRGTTAVGAYSPRVREGFPIAAPVTWKQVERGIKPDAFTMGHPLRPLRVLGHLILLCRACHQWIHGWHERSRKTLRKITKKVAILARKKRVRFRQERISAGATFEARRKFRIVPGDGPGGNATGMNILTQALEPKRLGLLQQLVPQATTFGVLLDPNYPPFENQLRDVEKSGRVLGLPVQILRAGTDSEIDEAFETILHQRIAALMVASGPFFDTRRDKLVGLAARHAVPTMYHFREFVAAGGLISYGIDSRDTYRQVGVYAGRILRGANPAELPVLQPTKFEFVINLRAAQMLGIKVSDNLLSIANEVIE
jgi:ABC transporter substrate binding protein